MRLFQDLWAASPRRCGVIAALIVLGGASQAAAAALAGPVLVSRAGWLFLLLAFSLVLVAVSGLMLDLVAARLTAAWSATLRRQLCEVAFGQPLTTLEVTPVGELLDRIDGDVYQVASGVRGQGIRLIQASAAAMLSILVAIFVWWPAGVAMLLVSVILVLLLRRPVSKIAPARAEEEEAWSDLAAVIEESIHGQDDIRTSLARPYVISLFVNRSKAVLDRGRRVWRMSAGVTFQAVWITRATIALVAAGGAIGLSYGYVSGAQLTAVWLLGLGFAVTIEHVSRMVPELQTAFGAWTRIQQLRATVQEPSGGKVPVRGDLAIRNLDFSYGDEDGRPKALRNVNLTFTRGLSYALIGRTGSGKSTLSKVLTRAVEIPHGKVFLSGTDLLELDLDELRRYIAVVPQRTDIVAGTLAENIALFDPELVDAASRAIDELGLSTWAAELPDGMQTRLGDGGHILSAGQEQLVAFARILVRDPQVVILDEATARLDPVTEVWVQRATDRLLRDRIGIVVAHRLSSVRRCDQVIVLADGQVVESGPLGESLRFAELLAKSELADAVGVGIRRTVHVGQPDQPLTSDPLADAYAFAPAPEPLAENGLPEVSMGPALPKVDPPPLPAAPPARTLRQIIRLALNDPRYGLAGVAMFAVMVVAGLDGALLPWLWSDLVDGSRDVLWPTAGIVLALMFTAPASYFAGVWYPEWWVRQSLRTSLRFVHGQTGPRRVSGHTSGEVVAQSGDIDRVVFLADNVVDQVLCLVTLVSMTAITGSFVPALFFAGTMAVSGLVALLFGPRLAKSAQRTVSARAAFATALTSSLSAARTVKLAGASKPVLAHLAVLERMRSDRQYREIAMQVWARSTPSVLSGLLPISAWALYLGGTLTSGTVLVVVSTLGAARWFAWTTASLISQLPSARVWTKRTVEMAGVSDYAEALPGVDISAGTAPVPAVQPRNTLRHIELRDFGAVHEDGTVAAQGIDLTVGKGQLVLVLGPVGSGKSSLLRALAGLVHHTGTLRWNGEQVVEPEHFLRPNQVGYVAQLPRVLSGTIADNIALGYDVDPTRAVSTAQLTHDLSAASNGLALVIGHKGTKLSGGQLQRLALARALAPDTELLVADDVSSALDQTTELDLWKALREHGITVIGSTAKRAALMQADKVVVLMGGRSVAQGPWHELEADWHHLAG